MAKKKVKTKAPRVTEDDGRPLVEDLDNHGLPLSPDGCGRCEQQLTTACAHCGSSFLDAAEVKKHQAHSTCGAWLAKAKDPQVRSFTQAVHVPPPDAQQQAARSRACVHHDHEQRLVLELSRTANAVHVVERLADGRFGLATHELKSFEQTYQPIVDYPTGRAATLFVEFTTQSGADEDVLSALANLVAVQQEEKEMAATRTAAPSRTATKPATNGAPAKKPAAVKTKAPGEKRVTESSRMREMLMTGKMTDDQILAAILKEFKGSRAKLSYVSWQRNDMRKKGIKVPEVKGAKPAAAATKPAKKSAARASA